MQGVDVVKNIEATVNYAVSDCIEYKEWQSEDGWFVDPRTGHKVKIGKGCSISAEAVIADKVEIGDTVNIFHGVRIGPGAKIGSGTKVGKYAVIGNNVVVGQNCEICPCVTIDEYTAIGDSSRIGSLTEIGAHVMIDWKSFIGSESEIWDGTRIGENFQCGERVVIEDVVVISHNVKFLSWCRIGSHARIGNDVSLDNSTIIQRNAVIADGTSSGTLRNSLKWGYLDEGDTHVFWKWVRKDRSSPDEDRGDRAVYSKGATIDGSYYGIQVVRPGYRPEWVGLVSSPDHKLVPVKVLVNVEDILNPGLPGNDAVVCVRKLQVMS